MTLILQILLGAAIVLIPVYLWGYGTSIVLGYNWQRFRFFTGIFLGILSVWGMYFLEKFSGLSFFEKFGIFSIFLLSILLIVMIFTGFGSVYARGFLRRIALGHILLIFLSGLILFILAAYIPSLTFLSGFSFALLVTSLFEESSKHLVSLGLAGQDFRFSRSDIFSFTLFSVLGFVFAENVLYLTASDTTFFDWVYRSLFTIVAHVFAASLCAYYWWKALSYELFSLRYILTFLLGFALAILAHTVYNICAVSGSFLLLSLYVVIGYMVFVVMSKHRA